jgi:hypothetical protein
MEVARSASTPMAIPQASQVAPPGARDAADGFSQVSTRDLKPSVATPPAAGASQTTVAEPAPPPVEAGQAKPPPQGGANGSTAAGWGSRASSVSARSPRGRQTALRPGLGCPRGSLHRYMTGPGLGSERRAPLGSGKNCSHSSSSRLFSLKIRYRYAQVRACDRQRVNVVANALARNSQLAQYAPVGRAISALSSVFTNLHTTPLTRSKTPPRAPASTYPPRKRPARTGAPRPTALRRTYPTRPRGSPLPRDHDQKPRPPRTRPSPPGRPILVKRARRRPRTHIHTTKRRAPLNASRTCAPGVN